MQNKSEKPQYFHENQYKALFTHQRYHNEREKRWKTQTQRHGWKTVNETTFFADRSFFSYYKKLQNFIHIIVL